MGESIEWGGVFEELAYDEGMRHGYQEAIDRLDRHADAVRLAWGWSVTKEDEAICRKAVELLEAARLRFPPEK